MKAYNHLIGYLHRWTVYKLGKLHVRIHHILSGDGTHFLHNHPFAYVSVIYKGGYVEQVLVGDEIKYIRHTAPAVIIRKPSTYHRIVTTFGGCRTLFFAYGTSSWDLKLHPDIKAPPTYITPFCDGIYLRQINGEPMFSKFENGMWYVGSDEYEAAALSTKLSIHQCGKWESMEAMDV